MSGSAGAILITGCSSGIGRATAERLARRGHTVYATARKLDAIVGLEAAGCRPLRLDTTDEASMVDAIRTVEARDGSVGALVNNAGYGLQGAIEEVALDDVRRQFETNLFGAIRLAQLVLPQMRQRRSGRIVMVGSMGGKLTFPGGGIYHATKHAMEAVSDALRFETRGFGVRVSLVQPGLIRTEYGTTALATLEGHDPASPYARLIDAVVDNTRNAYDGGLYARLARGPESVAAAIEHAVTAKRPKTRYRVAPSAGVFMRARRYLPDPFWDALLRRSYPTPR